MIGNDRYEFLSTTIDELFNYFESRGILSSKTSIGRTNSYLIVYPSEFMGKLYLNNFDSHRAIYGSFDHYFDNVYKANDEKYNTWILEHISYVIQKQLIKFHMDKISIEFRVDKNFGMKNKMYVVKDDGSFYFEKLY